MPSKDSSFHARNLCVQLLESAVASSAGSSGYPIISNLHVLVLLRSHALNAFAISLARPRTLHYTSNFHTSNFQASISVIGFQFFNKESCGGTEEDLLKCQLEMDVSGLKFAGPFRPLPSFLKVCSAAELRPLAVAPSKGTEGLVFDAARQVQIFVFCCGKCRFMLLIAFRFLHQPVGDVGCVCTTTLCQILAVGA